MGELPDQGQHALGGHLHTQQIEDLLEDLEGNPIPRAGEGREAVPQLESRAEVPEHEGIRVEQKDATRAAFHLETAELVEEAF